MLPIRSLTDHDIMTDVTSTADTLISQVTPLLGIMPHGSTQLQSTNTPEDVKEILGTRAFQRYVDTPICHVWQRRPPFPVNLCELVSL